MKLSKMKYLLVLFFSLITFSVQAGNISLQQAEAYAKRFFSQSASPLSLNSGLQLVWKGENRQSRNKQDSPAFYVFNRGNKNGFIIISGNDATRPVLAYSFDGEFSTYNMPDNVEAWMNALGESVSQKGEETKSRATERSQEWNNTLKQGKVIDLNTPNWDQDSPYNLKCPVIYGTNCYTGCAITATAIVMGFHQWPDKGVGTLPKYTTYENGFRLGPITLGEEYHWDKMPDINNNYLDTTDKEQADAVSTIMYHIGVMAHADYSIVGTGARLHTIAEELPHYMKYHPRLKLKERQNYSNEEWSQMLRDEIDARRPVIYEGYDKTSGHAFVIDGYDEAGYFNVNWGWGGRYNAFFLLDDMAPGMQGIGANGSGTYNLGQAGIFGLEPRKDTEVEIDRLEYIASQSFANGLVVSGLELPAQKGDYILPEAGLVRNMGTNTVNGTLKLAMTDHKGNIIETFGNDRTETDWRPADNRIGTEYRSTYEITQEVKPGYRIRLLFKSTGSNEWKPVKCDPSVGQWEVILDNRLPQEESPIEESTELQYDVNTGLVTIQTLEGVKVTLIERGSNKDCSTALSHDKNKFIIKSRLLNRTGYILILEKGTDRKELELEF